VYDFTRAPANSPLDENSPLESDALDRDVYARTKLLQERLIRKFAQTSSWDLVVLRPGMIWGKDQLLNAWLGNAIGSKIWLRIGGDAQVPLTYVENCAPAIVLAAEVPAAAGGTFNIVDDDPPLQRHFLQEALKTFASKPAVLPVPYRALRWAGSMAFWINKKLFGGRGPLPGLLIPCRLDARAKPLTYSNWRIKELLGWTPRYSLSNALVRSAPDHSKRPITSK
jgi:nucleoside-diphosphate-sugar epimerase